MSTPRAARLSIGAAVFFCGAWAAGTCAAQTAAAPAPAPAAPTIIETIPGEPAVKVTVVEDGGSRIDELRVRGQTQRIVVTPKAGGRLIGKAYEIVTPAGSADLQEAPNGARGAAGKRVWHVLSF